MRLLPIVLLVAVVVYALIDCAGTPKDRVPGGLPKGAWIALIILLPGLGAVVWVVLSRVLAADSAPPPSGPAPWTPPNAPRRPPARPVAPDDDPAFLARLEAEHRRANRRPGGEANGQHGNGRTGGPARGDSTAGGSAGASGADTGTGHPRDGATPPGGKARPEPTDDDGADRDDSPDDNPASGDDKRA